MADPRPSWRSSLTTMLSARMLVALLMLEDKLRLLEYETFMLQ